MLRRAIHAQFLVLFAIAFGGQEPAIASSASTEAPRQRIVKALNAMLPEVNFKEADLADIVSFLSKEADVNIVINPVVYAQAAAPSTLRSPRAPEKESPPPTAKPGVPEEKPEAIGVEREPRFAKTGGITLHLKNVPLRVVLKYVLKYKNLRYIVEDYAIVILPIGWTAPEQLSTKVFRLRTGSFEGLRQFREQAGGPI